MNAGIARFTGRARGRREFYPEERFLIAKDQVDVSIILPTFNERANLEILIPRLRGLLSDYGYRFEILVVDDDSSDGTWQMIRDMSAQLPGVRLIRRIGEKGLSSAVVTGMASAMGRSFVIMDADLQHDENAIPGMIAALEDNDIVVGTRNGEGASYGQMGAFRRFLSKSATLFARLILGVSVTDPMSGFFALRRQAFEAIVAELNPRGFKILLEILARSRGVNIAEVGYSFRARLYGETKLDGAVILQFFLAIAEIRVGRWISPVFLKYAVIGSAGIGVNMLGQLLATEIFGLQYVRGLLWKPSIAVLLGFEVSVIFNYLANNAWTFRDRRREGFAANLNGIGKFHAVALYGFVIQLAVWHLLLGVLEGWGTEDSGLVGISYLANLAGILFATVNNFYLNKNFTWNRPRGKGGIGRPDGSVLQSG